MARFVLKDPQSKDKTTIFMLYFYNGKRLKYSTGKKVTVKDWNKEKQRMRKDSPNEKEINRHLLILSSLADECHTRVQNRGEAVNNDNLKHELDIELNRVKGSENKNLQFKSRKIMAMIPEEETDCIYLSVEELMKIKEAKLSP